MAPLIDCSLIPHFALPTTSHSIKSVSQSSEKVREFGNLGEIGARGSSRLHQTTEGSATLQKTTNCRLRRNHKSFYT